MRIGTKVVGTELQFALVLMRILLDKALVLVFYIQTYGRDL